MSRLSRLDTDVEHVAVLALKQAVARTRIHAREHIDCLGSALQNHRQRDAFRLGCVPVPMSEFQPRHQSQPAKGRPGSSGKCTIRGR